MVSVGAAKPLGATMGNAADVSVPAAAGRKKLHLWSYVNQSCNLFLFLLLRYIGEFSLPGLTI